MGRGDYGEPFFQLAKCGLDGSLPIQATWEEVSSDAFVVIESF